MITSIQIHQNIKEELTKLKVSSKESYEDIIKKLLQMYKEKNRKSTLIKGYKEMSSHSKKVNKEWESTDTEWN